MENTSTFLKLQYIVPGCSPRGAKYHWMSKKVRLRVTKMVHCAPDNKVTAAVTCVCVGEDKWNYRLVGQL